MDMWNWLVDCYDEGSITLEDLENVMIDEEEARLLWRDWAADSSDFVEWVRDEARPFIKHIKKLDEKLSR